MWNELSIILIFGTDVINCSFNIAGIGECHNTTVFKIVIILKLRIPKTTGRVYT